MLEVGVRVDEQVDFVCQLVNMRRDNYDGEDEEARTRSHLID